MSIFELVETPLDYCPDSLAEYAEQWHKCKKQDLHDEAQRINNYIERNLLELLNNDPPEVPIFKKAQEGWFLAPLVEILETWPGRRKWTKKDVIETLYEYRHYTTLDYWEEYRQDMLDILEICTTLEELENAFLAPDELCGFFEDFAEKYDSKESELSRKASTNG